MKGLVFVFSSFCLCRREQLIVETYGAGGWAGFQTSTQAQGIWTTSTQERQQYAPTVYCGPHSLNNTLMAQANHLAIFQVNVKHQLIWWRDSQQLLEASI